MSDVLQWTTLFFGAMVAGAMVLEFMMILPTLKRLDTSNAVETIKLMSPRAWQYLPVCGAIATLSAVGVLLVEDDVGGTETVLLIAALAGIAGFLFFSAGLYRQEDLRVRGWPTGGIAEEWPGALAKLQRLHVARMVLFLVAYGLLVAVVVAN